MNRLPISLLATPIKPATDIVAKTSVLLGIATLASCASSSYTQVSGAAPSSMISVSLGQRFIDDDFEPVEDEFTYGVEFSKDLPSAPLWWEVGFFASDDEDSGTNAEGSTQEFYGGVRRYFEDPGSKLHPYVGGGLSFMNAELDGGFIEDDDNVIGLYVHGGAVYDITPEWALGLDLRIFIGEDAELFGIDGSVDYTQLAVTASCRF